MLCPRCKLPSMEAMLHMELPPDGWSDEITLSLHLCGDCGFTGAGRYEESRRGALGHESWHSDGWPIARADFDRLEVLIRTCPDRAKAGCGCDAHALLGKHNALNAWDGLRENGYPLGTSYRVQTAEDHAGRVSAPPARPASRWRRWWRLIIG